MVPRDNQTTTTNQGNNISQSYGTDNHNDSENSMLHSNGIDTTTMSPSEQVGTYMNQVNSPTSNRAASESRTAVLRSRDKTKISVTMIDKYYDM